MANKIDQFWEIFKAVAGDTSADVTESTNAIAKSDRTKVESYFSNVIDQFSFETADYNRLRKFMIDLYASFRTQSSISLQSSDPHALTNSDLDELFRSMGYDLSASLRGFDENPLEQKVQFFLDLVNLYKVKGTPQSLVDVLQYYGVTEVDIYEFFLKKDAPDSLFFDGRAVAGTTVNPSDIGIPYNNLTSTDPHWLYTAQQILQLDQINKINLPSKTPYLGVQPTVDLEGAEMSIIERYVQDQYESWQSTGVVPPPNAEITYTGETVSLLELYLSCVYMFNKLFDQGSESPYGLSDYRSRFMCYDGTNVGSEVDILAEYDQLTKSKVETRDQLRERYYQHLDLFSRQVLLNFLVDENTAGNVLNSINPTLKAELDAAGEPLDVLYSLLKDLALWVRANIGFGFVNFGFILFGIEEFFKDLKPVIDFFKPYRARLLLIESLQIRNRLFNTIIVEDQMSVDADITFHDYLTGDSEPCCNTTDSTCVTEHTVCQREFVGGTPPSYNWRDSWQTDTSYAVDDAVASGLGFQWICIQAHTSGYETKPGTGTDWTLYWDLMSEVVCTDEAGGSYYSRDTYDCGSQYDLGAVTDKEGEHITVEDSIHDHLRCPAADGTGFVVSEILNVEYAQSYSTQITSGVDDVTVYFNRDQQSTNYSIGVSVRFDPTVNPGETPNQFGVLVTDKQISSFTLSFSGAVPSDSYYLDWFVVDSTCSAIVDLDATSSSKLVVIPDQGSTDYSISGIISNVVDSNPDIYGYTISDKTTNSFRVNFSGPLNSSNYKFEFFICPGDKFGNAPIAPGSTTVSHTFAFPLIHNQYPLTTVLESSDTNVYAWTVTEKTALGFTVELSAPADSTNYNLSWSVPDEASPGVVNIEYYQSGGFRDFDSEGTFDCTHGFDLVQITVEDVIAYLLQETGFYLLQENGARIIL